MKFRKFKQHKLWRDNAVNFIEQRGSKVTWTRLNDEEFSEQIKLKLMEEAEEVCAAKDKLELIEELADVLEVIDSFCEVNKFTLQDVMDKQKQKHQERGGFEGRKFVSVAEHPEGGYGEKYCLAAPEKYPEIID
ncbi:nucleoside triphosphate pyrophosphohydrolase [bacterium]|jgi:predicted house-cleaning noncanonical NTP pyrophosphatase (MazG superfamily)|nr:nucleoside triphosphate pyrophosphohydrolase [bacterium]MBT5014826.1 nucleoside triphosphate pyrophosphohydrolase [bacterium]